MKRNYRSARSGFLLVFLLATMHADAQRWTQLAKPATGPTPDLYGVHFFTRDSGYICGEAGGTGRLYFTADAGASWRDLTARLPGAPGPLNDIQFLPDGSGAIVGDNAYVALTADGGATWRQASVTRAAWPNGGDIQGVHVRGASEIFVAGKAAGSGNGPRIARSSDGGATWIAIPQTGSQNNLYAIDFFDAAHGVVVGTGVNARKSVTTDGGATWEPNGHIGSDPTRSLSFYGVDAVAGTPIAYASGGNVVGSGRFAELRKTTDHGRTWSTTALNASLPGNNKTANSVLAFTEGIIYVSTQGFRIHRSTDGGASWSLESLPAGSSDLRRICATPTDELYVVGRGGNVLRAALFAHPVALAPSLSFPPVCGGDTAVVADTIINTSIARLRIDSLTLEGASPPGVRLMVISSPSALGPGGSGAILLRAEVDRDAPPGRHDVMLRVRSNDSLYRGRDTLLSIPIALTVLPGEITLDPGIVADAGYVPIGRSRSLRLGEALRNAGRCPVSVTELGLAIGADFHLPDSVGTIVPGGGAADLTILFAPLAPCLRVDTLLIYHDASAAPSPLRVVVSGTGLEERFATEPGDTLRMRSAPVGDLVRDTLRLVNRKIGGCLDTTLVLSLEIAGPDAADFALETPIPPGGSLAIPPHDELRVPIVARPSAAGARGAMMIIAHTAPGSSPDTVMLAVRGLRPELTGTVESIGFGLTEVGSARDSVIDGALINLGGASSVIESLAVEGPDADDFIVTSPALPSNLSAGVASSLGLRFTPSVAGERSAVLRVQPRDGTSIVIRLGGRGAIPWFSIRRDSIGVSPTRVGACRDTTLDAFLRNDGELLVSIHTMTITGSPTGADGDTAAFSIIAPAIPPDLMLAPGDSTRVVLRFCPVADRRHDALLRIAGNRTGSPLQVRITGEGFRGPGFAVDTILFPPTPIALARDTVVERCLVNASPGAMIVDSVVVSGASFSLGGIAPPFTVPAWEAIAIPLRFAPAIAGPAIEYLRIYHDGQSAPLRGVVLAGTGLALALAYDTPTGAGGLDVGAVRVGRSAERIITVTNVSGAPLALDEIGATDPAFTIAPSRPAPLRLDAGERLELRVRFAPAATGPHRGMLRLGSGSLADSAMGLTGRGVMHALRVTSDTIDLGMRSAGEIVDTVILLINEPTPTLPLPEDLDAVTINGAGITPAAGFTVTGGAPGVVGANGRGTIALRYMAPSVPGAYAAALLIESDGHEVDGRMVADTLRVALLAGVEEARDTLFQAGASLGAGLTGGPGDIIHLPVILGRGIEEAGIDAIVLRIGFRPTMLKPLAVSGRGGVMAMFDADAPPGTLELRLTTSDIFVADTVASVAFKVLLGESDITTIRIDSIAAVDRSDVTLTADSARFAVVGLCDPEGELIRFGGALTLASKPNPVMAGEPVTIEYTLPAICDLRLGLFDATGSQSIRLAGGQGLPGSHVIPLDVTALPAGSYYCVLSAGRFSRTIIVRIIK